MNPFLPLACDKPTVDGFDPADPATICAIRLSVECAKRRANERDQKREALTPAVDRRQNGRAGRS